MKFVSNHVYVDVIHQIFLRIKYQCRMIYL